MSAIIATARGGICGICRHLFSPNEPQFTHVGGEAHDGFHKPCLIASLIASPTCPVDHLPLDANSLVTRIDRVMVTLKPALINTAYAVSFGILASAAGGAIAVVAAGIVVTGAAVRERVNREEAGIGEVTASATAGGMGVATIAAGSGTGLVGVIEAGIGAALGTGVDLILDSRGVDALARQNIGNGMSLAGIASLLVNPSTTLEFSQPSPSSQASPPPS